jgi:ABC-type Zn2+ transport system substrate-binding protein/surface adhesin
MKRMTLLKTSLAASIALTSLMALPGCLVGRDDRYNDMDHRDDHHDDHQDNHVDDHQPTDHPQDGIRDH